MKLLMFEAILHILIYFRNFPGYFLPLAHIEIEYLLLLLRIPNLMDKLILEHLIGDHGSIEIALDFLRHFESFPRELFEFLLEEVHPIIYQRIVLA